MLKILFFIETLGCGGAEKVLCDLVNHMDRTKFEVSVRTLWPCVGENKLAEGIEYRSVYPSRSRFNRFRMRLESALRLTYPLHLKGDYDIEVAFLECGTTKILSSSTNTRAVKIAWVHCDLVKAYDTPRNSMIRTAPWYARFDKIVCVSDGIKDCFDRLFSGRFPSVVINNVIDDETVIKYAEDDAPEIQNDGNPIVMAVGRLSVPKNYYRLLKAHKRILDEGIPHQLWIIGEGPERTKLERRVDELDIRSTVHMPGFRDNPYAYMNRADIIACSSSYEGFSTAVTEAVILGKPVVTTECPGMREILGDSEFGLITENDDDAFCGGLKKMLEDPEMRSRYGRKAAERGKAFSAAELTKATERFFTSLVK